jgi:hypothetical protein
MDKHMLEAFSRRTAEGLKQHTLFRMMLGPLQSFLEVNVSKEVEKDRQVILLAASLVEDGRFPTRLDVQRLLAMARDIDRAFLQQAAIFPVDLIIDYQDIEPVRQQRIQNLLNECHQLLRQWRTMTCMRDAMAALYDADQFEKLLFDFLNLYSLETKMLSHSVRMPAVLSFARESVTQTVYVVMESVARQLANELASRLYRRAS